MQGLLVAGVGVDPFDPDIYIFYKDDGTWSFGTYLSLVSSDEVRVRLFTSSIEYREGKREDVRNIEHLLYSCYDYGSERDSFTYFKRGLDSSQQVSLVTAYKLNVLVGAVTAWRTRFHPNCTYFSMAALPFIQNENIYKVFLQRIQNAHDVKFPLQTSLWETSHGLKLFLEKSGFRLIRKTVTPLLDISNVDPVDQFLLDIQVIHHQYSVMTLREAYTNHDLIDQFIALVKATYEKTHTANPLGVHDRKQWEKLVFSSDTLLDGSFIAIKDNEVVAFALLHHPTREHKLELGWRGAKLREEASQLVILLTNYQIKYARKNRFFRLEAEIDDTDEYAMEMLKYFPFAPAPAWLTYQKG
ncbi:hypothetical protein GCM10008967_30080 [Bacillus carboniphilus]|uniref:GNAT family N-acetyltransferase n=1 Tax=Bacillus carboniphilus TaxID=86663 RepID=A0ABN0WHP6_9BACI